MSKPNAKPQTEAPAPQSQEQSAQKAAAPAADVAAAVVQPPAAGQGGLYTIKDGQRVLVHQTQAE